MMKIVRLRPKEKAISAAKIEEAKPEDKVLLSLLYENFKSIEQKLSRIIDTKQAK